MDVIFGVLRRVVIDDQRHALDVQTTRSDVGSAKNLRVTDTEVLEGFLALGLGLVTMDGLAIHLCTIEAILELFAHLLLVAENQGAVLARSFLGDVELQEEFRELLHLFVRVHNLDDLRDALVGLQLVGVADADLVWPFQEIRGQFLHRRSPRGGEELRVPLFWNFSEDLPNLWLETCVEHAVCLVDDYL